MTLSQFQNKPAPPAAPEINWPKIDKQMADANPFAYLNFVLTLSPPVGPAAVEIPMRERFAKIGVEAGKPFPAGTLSPEQKAALELGAKNGMEAIKANLGGFGVEENGWRVTTNGFGDRKAFAGDLFVAPPPPRPGSTATTPSRPFIRCSRPTAKARSPIRAQTATR